jgi:hypothetical protein
MIEPPLIVAASVPVAWGEALKLLMRPGVHELEPLLVTITDVGSIWHEPNPPLRRELDRLLHGLRKQSTDTVANTIFPQSLWNPKRDRKLLYERYLRHVLPAIRSDNPHGTYFQRMIQFGGEESPVNQLEQVIGTWVEHGNHRHSALQISIFDPHSDHKHNRRLGFPCLHQVCFTPLGQNGVDGIALTGFYATQHLLTKAYGNYIGLIRLGHFVAQAIGLKLTRVTCFSAKVVLGDGITKEIPRSLHQSLITEGEAFVAS